MKRRTVKRILTYVRPYRAAFAASCASALLYVLFTLLGPVFTGRAIDNILGPGPVSYTHLDVYKRQVEQRGVTPPQGGNRYAR